MRIAVGAILFEGNTFSPVVATRENFAGKYLLYGAELFGLAGTGTEVGGAIAEAAAQGDVELVPLLATHGGAGGRVDSDFTRALVEDLISRLRDAAAIDGVYLALHGAYISEDSLDFEGDLMSKIRTFLPDLPMAVSCDMHAHITPPLAAGADILIGYKHYPHDDAAETGAKALRLLISSIRKEIRPVISCCRAPILLPAQKQRTRGSGPMARARAFAESLAQPPILDVSYFCTQPWLDAPDVGFTAVVTAHDDAQRSLTAAKALAQHMWSNRSCFLVETLSPEEAIKRGLMVDGLVVLADSADCAGGGSTGDSAAVLDAMLRVAPDASAAMHIVDPESVAAAAAVGKDRIGKFRIGNKLDSSYPPPVEIEAKVVNLFEGAYQYAGGLMKGIRTSMGPAAVLRIGDVWLLLASRSTYEYSDEAFLAGGIEARGKKFVIAKNPMNYQQAYPEAAATFVLRSPGATSPDLASLKWSRITRPLFPIDDQFDPVFPTFP